MDAKVYIKVLNFTQKDTPVPGGLVVTWEGVDWTEQEYSELIQNIDKAALLAYLRLDHLFQPEDIEVVSREEYLKLFPENEADIQNASSNPGGWAAGQPQTGTTLYLRQEDNLRNTVGLCEAACNVRNPERKHHRSVPQA